MLYRKVMVEDRTPKKNGWYLTDLGIHFFGGLASQGDFTTPNYWLEKVELPSEEEMANEGFEDSTCVTAFCKGANYIINKLKGND